MYSSAFKLKEMALLVMKIMTSCFKFNIVTNGHQI